MANTGNIARTLACVLSGALVLATIQPATAAPLPVSRDMGVDSAIETVQYRRGRAPVVKRKRGGNGAAAAAILGAVAIGAAAIAASNAEKRRQRRAEAYYYGGAPYGYAAQPYYAPQPQYYAPAPQYYDRSYQYRQPASRWRGQAVPRIDGGSPYAVQQQRVRQPRLYGEHPVYGVQRHPGRHWSVPSQSQIRDDSAPQSGF